MEGRQEGRQEGELALVVRLLQRQVGSLDELLEAQIRSLPIEQLEALGEALLAFTQPDDLSHWLQQNVEVTYPKKSL